MEICLELRVCVSNLCVSKVHVRLLYIVSIRDRLNVVAELPMVYSKCLAGGRGGEGIRVLKSDFVC